jgi:hypothetical protein
MADNTSYVCSACGVSSDNKKEALIHARGPLHAGMSVEQLYPGVVFEPEIKEMAPVLEKER